MRGRVRNGGEGVLDGEHSTNTYLFKKKKAPVTALQGPRMRLG